MIKRHAQNEFGKMGEKWCAEELARRGFSVVPRGGPKHYDFLVNGKARVEVKASHYSVRHLSNRTAAYQFSLRRYGLMVDEDLLILLCYNGSSDDPLGAFVIPGSEVRPTLKKISITSKDPAVYTGKWAKWWNAWDVVKDVVNGAGAVDKLEVEEIPF
jgi:hypothetical protein